MNDEDILKNLRQQIDNIDDTILANISTRARLAQEVGKFKQQHPQKQQVFYRPEREHQVLARVQQLNAGPLPNLEIARLFREIMSACLALEQPLAIAYLGPEGTFTQAAVLKQFGQSVTTCAKNSIAAVFKAVEDEDCHYGVVPVENSTEGMVSHTLDMFLNSSLKICGEVHVRVVQNLLTHAKELQDIDIVYSHAQSFAQCRLWLNENLPQAQQVVVSSNGEAARLSAAQQRSAAVASKLAGELYKLPILCANIEDESNNTTRFLVVGKQDIAPSGCDKTSILISSHNRPGLLYQLLEPISRHGVNMSRIESRPSRKEMWAYVFFIDLQGHQQQQQLIELFDELREKSILFKILGSYPIGAL